MGDNQIPRTVSYEGAVVDGSLKFSVVDKFSVFVDDDRSSEGGGWRTLEELGYDAREVIVKTVYNRRLLTVTPRYMLPTELADENAGGVCVRACVCVHVSACVCACA